MVFRNQSEHGPFLQKTCSPLCPEATYAFPKKRTVRTFTGQDTLGLGTRRAHDLQLHKGSSPWYQLLLLERVPFLGELI